MPLAHTAAVPLPSTFMHPAERKETSLAELYDLVRGAGRLRRELSFVEQDLRRVDALQKRIVYLLDYSEIHSFLWPDQPGSQTRYTIEHLFAAGRLQFALPPGAIYELLRKLSSLAAGSRESFPALGRFLEEQRVREFLDHGHTGDNATLEPLPALDAVKAETVLREASELQSLNDRLSRLGELLATKKLRFLSEIVAPRGLVPDREILEEAYARLMALRPQHDNVNNFVDAHNYAFTYALNNALYEKAQLYFLLVTASPTPYQVFADIKWREDPDFVAGSKAAFLMRTSLVRQPVHILYHNYLTFLGEEMMPVLERAKADLAGLQKDWTGVTAYSRWERNRTTSSAVAVRLPTHKRYRRRLSEFRSFYTKVCRPVQEIITVDSARDQNRLRLEQIGGDTGGPAYWLDEAAERALGDDIVPVASLRSVGALFERAFSLCRTQMERGTASLRHFDRAAVSDLDSDGLLEGDGEELLVERHEIAGVRTEFTVWANATDRAIGAGAFLCANRHRSHAAFWWRTNVTLVEFLRAARHYLGTVAKERCDGRTNPEAPRKFFDGVYLYSDTGQRHFPFSEGADLTTDKIVGLIRGLPGTRYLRIGTPFGDLGYDLEPIPPYPQRAGLSTHLRSTESCAVLVQWTNAKFVKRVAAIRVVEEILAGGNERDGREERAKRGKKRGSARS